MYYRVATITNNNAGTSEKTSTYIVSSVDAVGDVGDDDDTIADGNFADFTPPIGAPGLEADVGVTTADTDGSEQFEAGPDGDGDEDEDDDSTPGVVKLTVVEAETTGDRSCQLVPGRRFR